MTATTTTKDPAPKKPVLGTPTPEFFILDSGSSLSVTPRMADIINPDSHHRCRWIDHPCHPCW